MYNLSIFIIDSNEKHVQTEPPERMLVVVWYSICLSLCCWDLITWGVLERRPASGSAAYMNALTLKGHGGGLGTGAGNSREIGLTGPKNTETHSFSFNLFSRSWFHPDKTWCPRRYECRSQGRRKRRRRKKRNQSKQRSLWNISSAVIAISFINDTNIFSFLFGK